MRHVICQINNAKMEDDYNNCPTPYIKNCRMYTPPPSPDNKNDRDLRNLILKLKARLSKALLKVENGWEALSDEEILCLPVEEEEKHRVKSFLRRDLFEEKEKRSLEEIMVGNKGKSFSPLDALLFAVELDSSKMDTKMEIGREENSYLNMVSNKEKSHPMSNVVISTPPKNHNFVKKTFPNLSEFSSGLWEKGGRKREGGFLEDFEKQQLTKFVHI
jgi:hypothetical protein